MPKFIFERHHGANVFLSHYHYLNQLHNAFDADWKRRHATPFVDFSTEDIHFLQRSQEFRKDRRKSIVSSAREGLRLRESTMLT
jgi:hypothetical protein